MLSVTLSNKAAMPVIGLGVYLISDVTECERSVEAALRAGHRLVDTAALYGNERAVGRAIKASGVPRDEIFVTTKIWITDYGYDKTRAAIDEALERLDTGYIDLLLLHHPFGDYRGSWRALEQAVAEGTVRSIGVSNFRAEDLRKLLDGASIRPVVNQIELHPYFQQAELIPFLAENDIIPEAYHPLGHGSAELLEEAAVVALARRYDKSPAQVILRWHVQSGFVAIPKSTNPDHIRQNADVFDFELTADEMATINGLDRNRPLHRVPRWLLSALLRLARVRDRG